jgi:hypothetical protein
MTQAGLSKYPERLGHRRRPDGGGGRGLGQRAIGYEPPGRRAREKSSRAAAQEHAAGQAGPS